MNSGAELKETIEKVASQKARGALPSKLINPDDLIYNEAQDFVSSQALESIKTFFSENKWMVKLSKKNKVMQQVRFLAPDERPRTFLKLDCLTETYQYNIIAIYRDIRIPKERGKGYLGPKNKSADGWVKLGKVVFGPAKGTWVAVKYMSREDLCRIPFIDNEIRALKKQQRLIGSGMNDMVHFIASPLIPGLRLCDWKTSPSVVTRMKDDPRTLLKTLLITSIRYLEEVQYLHDHHNLNHGDVALWNVMINENQLALTLFDFARSSNVNDHFGDERVTNSSTPSYTIGDNIDCLLNIILLLDNPSLPVNSDLSSDLSNKEGEWQKWRKTASEVTWLKNFPELQQKVHKVCRLMVVAIDISRSDALKLYNLHFHITLLNQALYDLYGEKLTTKLTNLEKETHPLSWDLVTEYLRIGYQHYDWDMRPYLKDKLLLGNDPIHTHLPISHGKIDYQYEEIRRRSQPARMHMLATNLRKTLSMLCPKTSSRKPPLLFQHHDPHDSYESCSPSMSGSKPEKTAASTPHVHPDKKTALDTSAIPDTFEGIKAKIESSRDFTKKSDKEIYRDGLCGTFISPMTIDFMKTDEGTIFYKIQKFSISEMDPQQILVLDYTRVISISPRTGAIIEAYDYDSFQKKLSKSTEYEVSFTGRTIQMDVRKSPAKVVKP